MAKGMYGSKVRGARKPKKMKGMKGETGVGKKMKKTGMGQSISKACFGVNG